MRLFLLLLLVFSALGSFLAAWAIWRYRQRPNALPLAALSICAGLWSVCYLFEVFSSDLATATFWGSVKYPFVVLAPYTLAVFVMRFAGFQDWPGPRWRAILLIVPALTVLFVLTNSFHQQFWLSATLVVRDGYFTRLVEHGPLFWLNTVYSYGLILVSMSAAFSQMSHLWHIYRRQISLLAAGLSIPLLANALTLAGIQLLPGLDPSPMAFSLGVFFLLLTTRLTGLFNVVPLAYTNLVEQLRDGVLVLDVENRILNLNRAAEDALQVQRQELIGKYLEEITHPALQGLQSLENMTILREFQLGDAQNPRWYELRVSGVTTTNGQQAGRVAVWHEVTQRRQMEDDLRYTSTHDSLTGLYNRMFYEAELQHLKLSRRWPLTVLMIDLDNLKCVNDRLGHAAGDQLLCRTANLLQHTLRTGDLVARIGGDEFAMALPNCDREGAAHLVARLSAALEKDNHSQPDQVELGFSVGWAVASSDDELNEALKKADDLMYQDKQRKKAATRPPGA